MNKMKYQIFIVLVMLVLLVPFAGMLFWPTNETTENTVMAGWPKLQTEDGWNTDYLAQAGEYFEDHFAFRQQLVTANALLRGKLLKTSATDQVVVGKEDWLYFSGTLDDYQGKQMLSDREMYAVVHNLELMKNYVESQGSRFIFTVAPNKNSLYNDHMPGRYPAGTDSNLKRLTKKLEEKGIPYADLYEAFEQQEEVLYFRRDSHWNNKGAVLACHVLMEQMGKEHESYKNIPCEVVVEHTGDIDEMLYPLAVEKEPDYQYQKEWEYAYVNDVTDHMDDWIETENPKEEGTLLMYRDSFGESLLPFMAEEMQYAYFSRLVPYNLTQVEEYLPDYVVIERVERKIAALATEVPIMEPVMAEAMTAPEMETDTTVETEASGSYLLIKGKVDQNYLDEETDIYVQVREEQTLQTKTYPAFYTLTKDGDGNGYQVYLKGSSVPEGDLRINIILAGKEQKTIAASKNVKWDGGK